MSEGMSVPEDAITFSFNESSQEAASVSAAPDEQQARQHSYDELGADFLAQAEAAEAEGSRILAAYSQERTSGYRDFHNEGHSDAVRARYEKLAWAVRDIDPSIISVREIRKKMVLAKLHDIVQDATCSLEGDVVDIQLIRSRGTGEWENEGETVIQSWVGFLEKSDYEELGFTEEEIRETVFVTVPDFSFNPESGLRVSQPFLNAETPASDFLIAMSDLSYPGLEDYDTYMSQSWGEFRELYAGVSFAIRERDTAAISDAVRVKIASKALAWVASTPTFIEWRQFYFEANLDGGSRHGVGVEANRELNASEHADEIKAALRNQFSHFDDNIQASHEQYADMVQRFAGVSVEEYSAMPAQERLEHLQENLSPGAENGNEVFFELLEIMGFDPEEPPWDLEVGGVSSEFINSIISPEDAPGGVAPAEKRGQRRSGGLKRFIGEIDSRVAKENPQ